MDKEQYNNIIANSLQSNQGNNSNFCLLTVKNILIKMGIPLPIGNLREIYNILQTNNYMGWHLCTLSEAKRATEQGIAAIGIGKNKISIIAEEDEEISKNNNEAILAISDSTDIHSVSDMLFYSYTAMRTSGDQYGYDNWSSLTAAKNYYGTDFEYTYCGGYYNYYYTFSDGSRMYFRVP